MKALTYVEIDIDYCSLTYGVPPCQASLSSSPPTGTKKCFNSRVTCQDIANFTDLGATLRFAMPAAYLPKNIEAMPNIISVELTPGTLEPGESLGGRASLKVVFRDSPHSDTGTGYDKYVSERTYDPYRQGSHFGKFKTRHPFLQGRNIRVIRGLLGEALVDMDTRHYVIESTEGPSWDGQFTVIAKDILKLADGDRAQAPLLSAGKLDTAITVGATFMRLTPPGVGAQYPATGFINLGGSEVVAFTRTENATWLCHGEGTDGQTTFTDSAGAKPVSRGGNTQVDTAQFKFGAASVLFDGGDDTLICTTALADPDFAFGAGDFSIDFWMRIPGIQNSQLIDFRFNVGDLAPGIRIDSTGVIFYDTNVNRIQSAAGVIVTNTWQHVALCRQGTSTRLFVGGTQVGSTYIGADNLIIGGTSGRPIWGARTDGLLDYNGWIDEMRITKGRADFTANFTPPVAAYSALGDGATITRAQFNTVAVAHEADERAQLCVRYNGVDPANIISDLLQTYAGVPSTYIPLASWLAETAAFLGQVYSAVITEPMSVRDLIDEIIDIAALSVWWDDRAQLVRLQVLRAIPTTAATFTKDDRREDTLKIKDLSEKRLSQVWTYFAQINPLLKLDQLDNFRSVAQSVDAAAELDYQQSVIRKRQTRWISTGGQTIALASNAIQLARYRNPPRRFNFAVFRRYSPDQDPSLGGGYQITAWPLQLDTGEPATIPIQITRMNPKADEFDIEAEEMRFQAIVTNPTNRTIVLDANNMNVNLRTLHDSLYVAPVSGNNIFLIINAGVVIGSTSTALPALDVGTWPAGVTVQVTLDVGARIQGRGGDGGNQLGQNGFAGGPAFYTRKTVALINNGQIYGGGGGGEGAGSVEGGGGGAGTNPGVGGAGTFPGASGTADAGGAAGAGGGGGAGAGGGPGAAGVKGSSGFSPGAAGASIDGISFVTLSGSGAELGPQIN
jgi:hypothetical protein